MLKVEQQLLHSFLDFVEKVCPWFPEEGSINLVTWKKVGERVQVIIMYMDQVMCL